MALKIFINKGNLLINSVEPADGMIIGRSPDSALHLDDTMISRQHAVIHEINGQFVLEDLNSANGLIVEGRMEKKIILEAGLNIEVPPYTLNVTGNDDVESPRSLDELMREEIPAEAFQEEISAGTKKTSNEVTDVEVIAEAKIETPKIVGARTIIIPFEAKPRFYPLNMAMSQEFLGLMEDIAIIGRTADSDIVLSHASVSSRHALLTRQGEHYFIEDQQSTNGVRLNGELVKESLLKCHDILEFGEVQLEYIEGPALPQGRSHNVVEIVENPEFEGITLKPNLGMQQLSAKFLPKVRQISIALGCALLLLIVAPMLRRPNQSQQMQETVNVALNLPNVKQEAEPEKDRIIQHQLSLARQLMQNEKYAEAKVKVDLILEKLDPNNLEAKTFREEMLRVTNLIAQQKREKQQRLIEYQERIKNLIMLAGQSLDSKQYDEAKALYRQILGIDSDNSLAKESLARIEMLVAKNAADAAKTRSMQADLNESFTQGMVAYNAGNLTLAAKYLRDLIGHAENQHFNQARIAMDDIEEHLKVEIEEKLNDARAHFSNGRLLEARQLLQDILSADPKQQDARALNQQVLAESRERAQQIFREAYTYEHLVQDYNTAKDRYQKVLELLPETNEEYHQKAQARLKTLN